MVIVDSVEKVITRYFVSVTAEEFEFKGVVYKPRTLKVSPYIFRGFTCPSGCGACCKRWSLDYLPNKIEPHPYKLKKRMIEFDGRKVPIWSDLNDDHDSYYCRNVNEENGRCGVHGKHPFSCDFELIRFISQDNEIKKHDEKRRTTLIESKGPPANVLTTQLYGRGWALKKVDDTRGAKCDLTPPSAETVADTVRKMKRLKQWCEHFGMQHKMDRIIDYVEKGPWSVPLYL